MKIQRNTTKQRTFILSLGAAVLIGGTLAAYAFSSFSNKPSETQINNVNLAAPTKDEINAGSDVKEDVISSENSSNTKTSDAPEKEQGFNIKISAVNQTDTILQIRTVINTLSNAGECTLIMTKDSKSVTRTAGTYASANISSCRGFDIPLAEVSPGSWNLSINLRINDKTTSVEQRVDIK